jgi:hypothetical protein
VTEDALPDRVAALLGDHLREEAAEGRITVLGSTGRAFDVLVPSDWKETVAATLEVGERALRAEAFFLRAPEEEGGAAYRVLLERNLRPGPWRFAASDAGDVWLVAELPLSVVDAEAVDRLLGGLAALTDETYRPYFRRAFATSLAEQVARGGPGLDALPPWARDPNGMPPGP